MNDQEKKGEEYVDWATQTVSLMSPNKMLVESATMIYILAFMMFSMVMLIWKGPSLGTGEMMAMFFGLLLTISIAIRQYAAFRY